MLLGTSASLLVTSALLVVTRSYLVTRSYVCILLSTSQVKDLQVLEVTGKTSGSSSDECVELSSKPSCALCNSCCVHARVERAVEELPRLCWNWPNLQAGCVVRVRNRRSQKATTHWFVLQHGIIGSILLEMRLSGVRQIKH